MGDDFIFSTKCRHFSFRGTIRRGGFTVNWSHNLSECKAAEGFEWQMAAEKSRGRMIRKEMKKNHPAKVHFQYITGLRVPGNNKEQASTENLVSVSCLFIRCWISSFKLLFIVQKEDFDHWWDFSDGSSWMLTSACCCMCSCESFSSLSQLFLP